MTKQIFFICLITIFLSQLNAYSQGYTPPNLVLGVSLDGNFATNDAHGSSVSDPNTYGMVWGRGATLYTKIGFGLRKNHRLTLSATYNHMVNDTENKLPFFVFTPKEGSPYSKFDIFTGAIGYEYAFNARCRNKQYLGFAVTTNLISGEAFFVKSPTESVMMTYDNAFRIGAMISTGYEFIIDKNYQVGILLGLKYHLMNILNTQNGVNSLNDGAGTPGPQFWRRIGMLSLNFGLNFYTGVKPYYGPQYKK